MKINNLENKKIAILGFGEEGKSSLEFLLKIGVKDITILDKNPINIVKLENNISIIFGENYLDNLEIYDIIIKTPGISLYNEKIKPFTHKITSQTQIFFENYNGKIIGVTATKGKSTTSSLINNFLINSGFKSKLVGNIGTPVLDQFKIENGKFILDEDFVVYELSSYMLENFIPKCFISVLGNIFPDHIPWHINFINYKNAKLNIIKKSSFSLVSGYIYPNLEKNLLNRKILSFGPEKSYYSHNENYFYINGKKIETKIETKLIGNHNLDNMCVILGICDYLKINKNILFKTIADFKNLPYRLDNIGTYNGITFIDDSLSTTPESTIEAIKAYDQKIGTIFLGGENRGYNFEKLIKTLKKSAIKNIVLFPDSGNDIYKLLNREEYNILKTDNMKDAVNFSFKNTLKGKVCLLSTASPSYSLWKEGHKQKSAEFKREVKIYTQK